MSLLHMAPLSMLKHIETSQSIIKGSLSWNQTQAYHLSHSLSTSIFNLLTGCSRYWRAISIVPYVPSMGLTLLTNPFSSVTVATIFAIGQLFRSAASLSRTVSPTLQFLLMVFHFCQHWSVARTSFLHLLQISLEMCCTLLQCLWQ